MRELSKEEVLNFWKETERKTNVYIHNFDPEKSSNPFAYFTQIIYYAFIRRIQKEKKQLYIKFITFPSRHKWQ